MSLVLIPGTKRKNATGGNIQRKCHLGGHISILPWSSAVPLGFGVRTDFPFIEQLTNANQCSLPKRNCIFEARRTQREELRWIWGWKVFPTLLISEASATPLLYFKSPLLTLPLNHSRQSIVFYIFFLIFHLETLNRHGGTWEA